MEATNDHRPYAAHRSHRRDPDPTRPAAAQLYRRDLPDRDRRPRSLSQPDPLADRDHDPPADLAVDDIAGGADYVGERDRARHRLELVAVEVAGQSVPGRDADGLRGAHGIHAEQRHAAQDE